MIFLPVIAIAWPHLSLRPSFFPVAYRSFTIHSSKTDQLLWGTSAGPLFQVFTGKEDRRSPAIGRSQLGKWLEHSPQDLGRNQHS